MNTSRGTNWKKYLRKESKGNANRNVKFQRNKKLTSFIHQKTFSWEVAGAVTPKHQENGFFDIQHWLWSQHGPRSRHKENHTDLFPWALVSRSSPWKGSMDFRQLRLCKRIALKDRGSLRRRSAGRPLGAARNCKASLSANGEMKSIHP